MNIIKIISITVTTKQYDDHIFPGYAQDSPFSHPRCQRWLTTPRHLFLKPISLPARDVIGHWCG